MSTENRELQTLKRRYDQLIKRLDKAIIYYEDPTIPHADKEKNFEHFRELLRQTAFTSYEIANWARE